MIAHGGMMAIDRGVPSAVARGRMIAGVGTRATGQLSIHDEPEVLHVIARYPSPAAATSEARFVSPQGHVACIDGRIDNRDELIERTRQPAAIENANLIYELWQRNGEACLAHIIGDWALAIVSPDLHEVILAKDYAGTRPLDYTICRGIVAWASELEALLAIHQRVPDFDTDYLLGFVESHPPVDRTPFRGITPVPPGCVVRINASGVSTSQYVQLEFANGHPNWSDKDYEAGFRSIFSRAVGDRLNVSGPLWAELSGGVDSSSIVFEACRLLRQRTGSQRLRTLTYTFKQSSATNEDSFIELAEQSLGHAIEPKHVHETDIALFSGPRTDPPILRPNAGCGRPAAVGAILQRDGASVLLSGLGGDGIMWSEFRPFLPLSDSFRSMRLRGAFASALDWAIFSGTTIWDILWTDGIRQAFWPGGLDAAPARWLKMTRQRAQSLKTGLPQHRRPGILPSVHEGLRRVEYMIRVLGVHGFRSWGTVEATFPYMDRRLVEFMLKTPAHQKLRASQTRSLHRRALGNLLPLEIAKRESKAEGSSGVIAALNREWPVVKAWFDHTSRLAELGLVELSALNDCLHEVRIGRAWDVFSLMRAVALEGWLRSVDGLKIPGANDDCHSLVYPKKERR